MSGKQISNKAALFAVAMALAVGFITSLAVRPVHIGTSQSLDSSETQSASQVRVRWRVPVVFQTTWPVLGDNPVYVSQMIKDASRGAFLLDIFEPNEIVPPFSITDAVREQKIEAGYTWLGYDQGKIPASALVGAVPFGMEPWEYSAWWFEGNGKNLTETLYKKHNIHPIFCGMTGPETAGWFRKPIQSLEDLKGLKIRFAGLGGKVIEQLGASVTMLPGSEIFQALEKGAIDATEFALPIVDQQLGFDQVAKYNYYPGWHQPFTASHLIVNLTTWDSLDSNDQSLLELACTAVVIRNLSSSEGKQGAVVARFEETGALPTVLSLEILRELERVTKRVLEQEAERDKDFAVIYESQLEFRQNYSHWKSRAYLPRDF